MTPVSAEVIAIAGVGVALLAVLVPLLLTIGRRIDSLAADVAGTVREPRLSWMRARPAIAAYAETLADVEPLVAAAD